MPNIELGINFKPKSDLLITIIDLSAVYDRQKSL